MVVVLLFKAQQGMSWNAVTAEEAKLKEKSKADSAPSKDKDPSAGIMDLMKKMYDEGDDKMKQVWQDGLKVENVAKYLPYEYFHSIYIEVAKCLFVSLRYYSYLKLNSLVVNALNSLSMNIKFLMIAFHASLLAGNCIENIQLRCLFIASCNFYT